MTFCQIVLPAEIVIINHFHFFTFGPIPLIADKPPRQIVFHVHVRKCGGSTFHSQILRRQFGDGFYRDSSLIDYQYSNEQVQVIIDDCPWLHAYSSHKISLDLPYGRNEQKIIAIAIVREPVNRLISHYTYHRSHAKQWDPSAANESLTEYFNRLADSNRLATERQFSQLAQLTAEFDEAGLSKLSRWLEHDDIVLAPVERFNEVCIYLETVYPALFTDCAYDNSVNQSVQRLETDQADREQVSRLVPQVEFDLHQIASDRFDQQLSSAGLTDARLTSRIDQFLARSKQTRRNKRKGFGQLFSRRPK